MKFASALVVAVSIATASAAACTDNYKKINGALHTLDKGAKNATVFLRGIPDDQPFPINDAVTLLQGTNELKQALANATTECQNGCPFTAKEAKTGYAFLSGPLYKDTSALLQEIVNHEPALDKYKSIVRQQVAQVQSSVDSFGNCLISKAPSSYSAKAKVLIGKYDARFQAIATAYA